MNREFLDFFEQELRLLKEQAKEFADEYPGIASRLGGLIEDRPDNMVLGILEGAAYLAARVQLKLKHEFPEFTNNLLDQLVPNYLAPTPSVLLARVIPPYGDAALRDGWPIGRGAYMEANYVERERRVSCRFRLTSDIVLWPFEVTQAEYFVTPGPLQTFGLDVGREVQAGLRLALTCRSAADPADEVGELEALKAPDKQIAGCKVNELPVHFLGEEADAVALYEQCFANCRGVYFSYRDEFGNPVRPALELPKSALVQIGLSEEERLLPKDTRIFDGFDLLREYFMFPRKFLGFKLTGLAELVRRLRVKSVDLLFAFDAVNQRLAAAVRADRFALYAAPAINLFKMDAARIELKPNQHEYHIVPDRSRPLDFEPHQLLEVYAHYHGVREKIPVPPLYSAQADGTSYASNLFYTLRRMPRRRTVEEKKYGVRSDYAGTDMFLSLVEPGRIDEEQPIAELSLKALCSNRHLTEHLPIGAAGTDFHFLDDTTLKIVCADGPTPPREAVVSQLRSRTEIAHTGTVAWRLINMLSLNHLGLVERGAGRNGEALRQILSMFAEMNDSATEKKIRGVRSVDSRPVVRRIRRRTGIGAARGIEIAVTLDEKAFEGSGVFLLGAILDRFFAEYAAINSFTETVVRTIERGEIMRWPPRVGSRGAL